MARFRPRGESPRAAPLARERCGGQAPLIRRTPHTAKRGAEVWTFECRDCGEQMQQTNDSALK